MHMENSSLRDPSVGSSSVLRKGVDPVRSYEEAKDEMECIASAICRQVTVI
jgi:hypothetical protein